MKSYKAKVVSPAKSNPRKARLIPAKVLIGPGGKMRVFVSAASARRLKGNPNRPLNSIYWDLYIPPTSNQGNYKMTVRGITLSEARRDALHIYNSGRAHDGLNSVKKLPSGTKLTRQI